MTGMWPMLTVVMMSEIGVSSASSTLIGCLTSQPASDWPELCVGCYKASAGETQKNTKTQAQQLRRGAEHVSLFKSLRFRKKRRKSESSPHQ